MSDKVCLVTGVGPGTGAAIVRRFASEYQVAMIARSKERLDELSSEIPNAHVFPCDVAEISEIESTVADIEHRLGSTEILVHNAVRGTFGTFQDLSVRDLERNFRVSVTSFLRFVQLVSPGMIDRKRGSIICTGNTAAYRGVPNFSGFAPTKAAQRILAESMARTLGPSGIHVGYVAIDAVISVPRMREAMRDRPDEFFAHPEDIAHEVWHLAHQPKSTWTFDTLIRPFGESW